ncbi:MAG: restriction endonuclease subunit S [Armatimonadota bacterium]
MSRTGGQDRKASGIEWLGDIPSSWTVAEIKLTHQVTLGKMLQSTPTTDADILLPYLRAAHIPPTGLRLADPKEMWFNPKERAQLTLKKGDVVVVEGGMGGYGRCDIVPEDILDWGFQNSINRLRPKDGNCGSYTKYLLQTAREAGYIDVLCSISTMPHLTAEKLGAIRLPLPPTREQWDIARFLDRETAKIDALIAKQEQLISTLREDRTVTITKAFTEGFDQDCDMDDQGIWLGISPRHWRRARLRDVITTIDSGVSVNGADTPTGPGEVGVLKTNCVTGGDGIFRPEANKTVLAEELSRVACPVRADTIIVNRANTAELVGSAGYVKQDAPDLFLSDLLWSVSVCGVNPEFIHLWMQSSVYRTQVRAWSSGFNPSMQKLAKASLRSFVISIPPASEQAEIVNRVSEQTRRLDRLLTKAGEVIATLREYRAALIADAVTGKIDVQGAVA